MTNGEQSSHAATSPTNSETVRSGAWLCELGAALRLAHAAVGYLDRQKKGPARAKMVRIGEMLSEIVDAERGRKRREHR